MCGFGLQLLDGVGLVGQEGDRPADRQGAALDVGPLEAQRLLPAEAAVQAQGAEGPGPGVRDGLHQLAGLFGGEPFLFLGLGVRG